LVGDLTLTGTGGTAGKRDTVNIAVSVNAPVANVATAPPLLLVDNPSPVSIGVNAFNGVAVNNQVTFTGVTFTEPGPAAVRTLRITNVRVNTTPLLTVSVPSILMTVALTGPVAIPIANPQQTVANIG
jgi:hypothetical protein